MSVFLERLMRVMRDPSKFWLWIVRRLSPLLPDKLYLTLLFHHYCGKWIDWKNPKGFNEKLQWLKVYNRKPEYTTMVDKVAVKAYVAQLIGEEYIIPTLGVWDDPEDIDFDALPDQFVLKCNHNSGVGLCICKDKSELDIEAVKSELRKGLKQDYYMLGREWPYKHVPRKILAEKYMVDETAGDYNRCGLTDYKFTCFNGVADNVMVCIDRASGDPKFYFFDKCWNLLPLNKRGLETPLDFKLPCPPVIDKMFEIAGRLSEGIPYLRVDLYYINNLIYFGETTFFPQNGFDANLLPLTEKVFGERIDLSSVNDKTIDV